ncbi:hypothetical protein HanRHA438_Chr09g0375541 [Helianthus annuus]|uniref:Uncharacterized protein n=1 Tax=Helianthus annuus TaxID=4232 RepID=A0A251TRN7_HELAN|nr:hypothetical protein HanXRQr2_Chr09g0363941 [Helianthus annuus]KAJ0524460.1 hypothetical protein HanHA300_Chr09g0300661 [Helianthus annuus]KAJ0540661.1 hypothetical protein HanHA89_Chr09g0319331 [Helianthus annuus]KAJ0705808.1 hypothetical protein HanLR1_Chr09g0299571 [Helianthus annuus]KAJ0709943.1 hypothetical protein HanOQP8_Chr09g0306381 [Helianthus annuus]
MRELLYYENLQHILVRVQKEMNATFVWLFQQVFSQTPTLMVYVMILLANYNVHSISHNFAIAPETTILTTTTVELVSETNFDSSSMNTFVTNLGGKTVVEASRGG